MREVAQRAGAGVMVRETEPLPASEMVPEGATIWREVTGVYSPAGKGLVTLLTVRVKLLTER
jgi:hypothetical protein